MPPKMHDLNAASLVIGTPALEPRPGAAQPKTARQRKPNLATAMKQARKAGVEVIGATLETDGRLSLTFGGSTNANACSTLDDWIVKHAHKIEGH
jgi:hypothetical protein